jgi:hypothetical protein
MSLFIFNMYVKLKDYKIKFKNFDERKIVYIYLSTNLFSVNLSIEFEF